MNNYYQQHVNYFKATRKKAARKTNLLSRLETVLQRFKYWQQRSRQRKHLANLDDYLLADIGYSRKQVEMEVAKPFWR